MSFKVTNCGHIHNTVNEARECVFQPKVEYKDRPGTMSRKQRDYLTNLGATSLDLIQNGEVLSMNQASKLIETLIKRDQESRKVAPNNEPTPLQKKLAFVKGMLDQVKDGYFAVQRDETEPLSFVRISTPKTGRYKGGRKIQTQHSEELILRAMLWPSGRWSTYIGFNVEQLLLVIADSEYAAITYGREIGRCCRCNAVLTDERSRFYSIGPECEKHWPHILDRVEAERGAYMPGRAS